MCVCVSSAKEGFEKVTVSRFPILFVRSLVRRIGAVCCVLDVLEADAAAVAAAAAADDDGGGIAADVIALCGFLPLVRNAVLDVSRSRDTHSGHSVCCLCTPVR